MSRSTTVDGPRSRDGRLDGDRAGGARRGADDAIDPRLAERRREVASHRRRRSRRIVLAIAISATMVAVGFGVSRSSALDVDDVHVSGNHRETVDAVRQASGVRVGDHLVDLDADRAAEAVRALPWVRDAVVERGWDGAVAISVTEREAAVALQTGKDGWLLVDVDRRVLAVAASPGDLPVIEGVPAMPPGQVLDDRSAGAIAAARALTPGLRTRVVVVDGSDPAGLVLKMRPAGTVRLGGADRLDQKVTSLQAVYAQADLTDLCTVDVRVPDSPVLTRAAPCA